MSRMKLVRRLLWVALIAAGVAVYASYQLKPAAPTLKGELGYVPAFTLIDQRGVAISDQNLRGSVWVANFVYTRCPSVCPMLSAKFRALQSTLGALPGVRYVSISVDPEHDTPAVLAEYAARFQADPARWLFLTGPIEQIEKTVVKGFKIHIGQASANANNPSLVDIMHGEHFVLVDREGALRGYYRSDDDGLQELEHDLRALAK